MSKRRKILWLFLILFVGIQFIQPARNVSNGQPTRADIHTVIAVPQNVETVLRNACYDCHSNNTSYPWYANVQPVGWFLANHIKEGKAELNFEEFGSYSLRKQQHKLKSIQSQIEEGEMPLSSYTLIHRNAILSEEQKSLIINWTKEAQNNLNSKK